MPVLSRFPWRAACARAVLTTLLSLFLLLGTLPAAPGAYAAPGDLDPTFGDNGIVITPIGSGRDDARALAVQADGKILVAGTANMGSTMNDVTLVRYNPDASLDPTFGDNGIVTTPISSSQDWASALAVQADGKILAAGTARMASTGQDFALVRYNPDGSLDTSFSDDGIVTTDIGSSFDYAYALAIQADGKILLAGAASMEGTGADFALVRYTDEGDLDPTFGNNGIVITPVAPGSSYDYAYAVAIQADGKIVAAGYAEMGDTWKDFALARYTDEGDLDPTFGDNGIVITSFRSGPGDDEVYGLAVQADGKILAAGRAYRADTLSDFALARYTDEGDLDPTFGDNGLVTTAVASNTGADYARALAIQPGGKIVVAGIAYMWSISGDDFALARYNPDGSLDTEFSDDGIVTTPIAPGTGTDYVYAVAIQADGKIVAAGYAEMGDTEGDVVLVRYEGDAPTAISLSSSSVDEGVAIGTLVGTLSATDLNANDSHTFSFVSETGNTDNGSFTIQGNQLLTNDQFDFEARSLYTISVRAMDSVGLSFEQPLTITINNVNEAPTAISLSAGSVDEGAAIGTLVGTLSAADPDAGDSHTFSLVPGAGDSDNASFTLDPISGNQLLANGPFDFEAQAQYTIRVSATDSGGLSFEQPFTITINNVNEAPTAISLSAGSVDEGVAISTTVGALSATDPDAGDSHTFSLVPGAGDTDNASFAVDGDQLLTKDEFDFETRSQYSIRVRVSDSGDLSFEQPLTITINNVNEAPVAVDDVVDPATRVFVGSGGAIAVLDNDTDPDGDLSLSVSAVATPTSGTATTDGTLVSFDPPDDANGTATFSYTLSDNHPTNPLTDEGQVTVTYVANDPRGDCNADGSLTEDDFDATVSEYFDDPADAPWWLVYAAGFAGSPQGCDSNADQVPDIADLICTVRLLAGEICGAEVAGAAATQATLHVALKVHEQTAVAHLSILEETVPVAATAFRLRYDPSQLTLLNPTDADGDGRPDSVQVSLPAGFDAWVTVDEQQGEVQAAVAAVNLPIQPLPSGQFMTIRFSRLSDSAPQLELHHLSAGDAIGATLPIQAMGDVTQENPRLFLPTVLH